VWTREQLHTVADLCQRHDVLLLVDEIHAPLVLPGAEYVPFMSIDHEMTSRAFTFTSASKGWNIPGLKCGLAVAGSAEGGKLITEHWEALLPGHLGVLASVAAFTDGQPWLDAVLQQLDQNRWLLQELLARQLPGAGYVPPHASFLAWIDCRDLGLAGDPAEVFLDRGRVALSPGPNFGAQGAGFARLNMGTSPELLGEAVRRMATAVHVAG
jgi:cystathionine beta-lyase